MLNIISAGKKTFFVDVFFAFVFFSYFLIANIA